MDAVDLALAIKQVWVYFIAGSIGVTFTVFYPIFAEGKKFHPKQIGTWLLLTLVFGIIVAVIDISPLLSIALGLGCQKLIKAYHEKLDSILELIKKISPRDVLLRVLNKDMISILQNIPDDTEKKVLPTKEKQDG